MQKVNKLWGHEEWLVNDEEVGYCFKRMTLYPGYQCSLHFHEKKDETFYVISGTLLLSVHGVVHKLSAGNYFRIKPYEIHRFWTTDDVCVFLEASSFHSDEDVTRLEDSRAL